MVYQVYPASFADSDGDGFGDLGGVLQRLDHLTDLGVDVLWLSPIFPTPWDDGGYDISDYTDIEPRFGTLATFDALLVAAHARGMKVILDLVANHTSDEHPWFRRVPARPGPVREARLLHLAAAASRLRRRCAGCGADELAQRVL